MPGEETARRAGLLYISDSDEGLTRRRCGRGFRYHYADGRPVRSPALLQRIDSLVIPPAWREVWICRDARGHIQATGRDDLGRKQYIYHPLWQETAAEEKYARLLAFGHALPRLRRRLIQSAAGGEPTLQRAAATVLMLMDHTAIRVGNEEYARRNRSYGLTTLRRKHLVQNGSGFQLRFAAKGGLWRDVLIDHPLLVPLLRQYDQLPGKRIFQYVGSSDRLVGVTADQVNEHLHQLIGLDVTAKDFRTWKASAFVAGQLHAAAATDKRSTRRVVSATIRAAAELLGNTITVCRQSYVYPRLVESYLDGEFASLTSNCNPRNSKWMSRCERVLLAFLQADRRQPRKVVRSADIAA
jgi:DNA topoisomerase I